MNWKRCLREYWGRTMTGRKKKVLIFLIAVCVIGLYFWLLELGAGYYGLELRTFMQMIKGCCLWLVVPFAVLFCGHYLIFGGGRGRFFALRVFVLAVLSLAILFAGLWRGLVYVLSSEMKEEHRTEDGLIDGVWADFLSETSHTYYVPVYGIFRREWPGWSEEEFREKIARDYGADAKVLEDIGDDRRLCRVPDRRTEGQYIYFTASTDTYEIRSNFAYQLLKSDAIHFWANRSRAAYLEDEDGEKYYSDLAERFEGRSTKDDPQAQDTLTVCCLGEEDIPACAGDILDWLLYLQEDERHADQAWLSFRVRIDLSGYPTALDAASLMLDGTLKGMPWEDAQRELAGRMETLWSDRERAMLLEEEKEQTEQYEEEPRELTDEEYSELFMSAYDGYYEKEVSVGDGQARYRMAAADAALGSRFYILLKSEDGGENWFVQSRDPFGGRMGGSVDFTFFDERFGFATLSHNGGDEADLYVTEDGGKSYQPVTMQQVTVTLSDGYTYVPYDYPQMPYEEDGAIYVLCGQGADGDYNGGECALYRSKDHGHTFTFVETQLK